MGEAKRRRDAGERPSSLPFDNIEEAWILIARHMVPPGAPDLIRERCRELFFLGAGALWDLFMHKMEAGDEPADADLRRMDRISAEMMRFREAMAAKAFGKSPGRGAGH